MIMYIHCIGISHNTAPIQLREQIAFSDEQIRASLARFSCGQITDKIAEIIIISTCNRIEIYAVSSSKSFAELENLIFDTHGASIDKLDPHLYRYTNAEAVRHLFNVAAGLDSLVIGEPQILGQVVQSLELARGIGTSGPLLSRLFQSAIRAGKRARTETAISRNPTSVSSLAAGVSERSVEDLPSAQVAILGAGEMAELAVEALRKRGVNHLTVINRTLERAHDLADRWNAKVDTFENLERVIANTDILITSTGAPHLIVHSGMVTTAMQQRPDRPLVLIDIAVPRDIDPEAGNVPNVHLYDIDNLNAHLEQSLAERTAEIPHVEEILAEEEDKFMNFLNSQDMLPLITDIHQQAETIRQAELQKTLRRLPDLTDEQRTRIEALTLSLVKKMLDHPTNRLRAEATLPNATEYAALARSLFGLEKRASNHYSDSSSISSQAAD
jgi:glutamyl-tRNA reductase